MEYRELLRQQELVAQRREHGPAADASERSLRLYPGGALRDVVSASAHPLNLEPLLLTLARPGNRDLRARFGEAAGEVTLIGKALGYAAVVGDLQVVSGRRVVDARDGLPYPAVRVGAGAGAASAGASAATGAGAAAQAAADASKTADAAASVAAAAADQGGGSSKPAAAEGAAPVSSALLDDTGLAPAPSPVSYEVWTRVEALAALTIMLRERAPRALLMAPPMQLRLLEELAGLAAGAEGLDAEAEAAAAVAAADAEAEEQAAAEGQAREDAKKVAEKAAAGGAEAATAAAAALSINKKKADAAAAAKKATKKEGDEGEAKETDAERDAREAQQAELKRAADRARRRERAAVSVAARRHPLLRLHALLALVESIKLFHAARPDAVHLHVDAQHKERKGEEEEEEEEAKADKKRGGEAAAAAGGASSTAAGAFDLLIVRAAMGMLEAAATAEDGADAYDAAAAAAAAASTAAAAAAAEAGTAPPPPAPGPPAPLAPAARALFRGDPVQRAKALAASCELLYMLAASAAPGTGGTGNYVPSNATAAGAGAEEGGGGAEEEGGGGARVSAARLMEGPPAAASPLGAPALAARGAAPLLARALEAAAAIVQQRRAAVVAAAAAAKDDKGKAKADKAAAPAKFSPEQIAEGNVPFGVNWQRYLGLALPTKGCAEDARVALELGGALLQAVSAAAALGAAAAAGGGGGDDKQPQLWPSEASLRGLANYEAPADAPADAPAAAVAAEALAAAAASALPVATARDEAALASSAAAVGALLLASAGYDETSAGAQPHRLHVSARAAHRALTDARLGKRCSACGKKEGRGGLAGGEGAGPGGEEVAALKRCAACHRAWYCGAACQRAAWRSMMHKEVCPLIAGGGLRRMRAAQGTAAGVDAGAAAVAAAGGEGVAAG